MDVVLHVITGDDATRANRVWMINIYVYTYALETFGLAPSGAKHTHGVVGYGCD